MNDVLQRLRMLEQAVDLLTAQVSRIRQVPSDQFRHREVFLGRCYNNGSYPSSGNTFPVTFVDATFTEAGGSQTPTVVERNTGNIVFAQNLLGSEIPAAGTMVPLVRENERWWTWYTPSGSGTDDADAFIRIKTGGAEASCAAVDKDVGECYWHGAVVTLAGSPNFCADPWTEGEAIWVMDATFCDKPPSLKRDQVYHARKLSDSYTPSGQSARKLYGIRHQDDLCERFLRMSTGSVTAQDTFKILVEQLAYPYTGDPVCAKVDLCDAIDECGVIANVLCDQIKALSTLDPMAAGDVVKLVAEVTSTGPSVACKKIELCTIFEGLVDYVYETDDDVTIPAYIMRDTPPDECQRISLCDIDVILLNNAGKDPNRDYVRVLRGNGTDWDCEYVEVVQPCSCPQPPLS